MKRQQKSLKRGGIKLEASIVFFCLAITLHNLEEAIWLPKWSQQVSKFQKPVTTSEFHFAVIVITALAYLSAFIYMNFPDFQLGKWLFIGFLSSMVLNAIFPHLLATIATKTYAPGLITGLLLNIPINSFILYQMFQQGVMTWRELIVSTVVVGPCLIALIPLLFWGGRQLSPFSHHA
ncbi:HXXEE domain-containing protein [Lysinibacillus sp. LZ02]|uniref:HXXEE domain-containing protein n=1 Tax=Lysinibacillus sp. LZ02 TaxID=3420668 RepID=UPI003D35CF75